MSDIQLGLFKNYDKKDNILMFIKQRQNGLKEGNCIYGVISKLQLNQTSINSWHQGKKSYQRVKLKQIQKCLTCSNKWLWIYQKNWFLDKKKSLVVRVLKKNPRVKNHILQEGLICLGNLGFGRLRILQRYIQANIHSYCICYLFICVHKEMQLEEGLLLTKL